MYNQSFQTGYLRRAAYQKQVEVFTPILIDVHDITGGKTFAKN